jgi:hypothetical protein
MNTSQETHYVSATETNRLMLFTVRTIRNTQMQSAPHRKHNYVSATETNRLMLFEETVAAYCECRMEHKNTLCRGRLQICVCVFR